MIRMRPIPNVVWDELVIMGPRADAAIELLMAVALRRWMFFP